jgi:integrase/recombinase XerD
VRAAIEDFILYLATERGLSDNYQLSTRLSLEGFAHWLERRSVIADDTDAEEAAPLPAIAPGAITHQQITDYLAHKKRLGLSA